MEVAHSNQGNIHVITFSGVFNKSRLQMELLGYQAYHGKLIFDFSGVSDLVSRVNDIAYILDQWSAAQSVQMRVVVPNEVYDRFFSWLGSQVVEVSLENAIGSLNL